MVPKGLHIMSVMNVFIIPCTRNMKSLVHGHSVSFVLEGSKFYLTIKKKCDRTFDNSKETDNDQC